MDAYFDTAIILKLYVQEATSPDAVRLANEFPTPYLLTPWQEIEARTALRLKAFRKEITTAEMQASLEAFEETFCPVAGKHPKARKQPYGDLPATFPTVTPLQLVAARWISFTSPWH